MTAQIKQFFQYLLPDSNLLQLECSDLDTDQRHLRLSVCSIQRSAPCPLCSTPSARVHSHYERTLRDLPCADFSLTFVLQVCKFFCDNPSCIRRIFTERIPNVAAPWARKTARLIRQLESIGLALGGAAGARLATRIGPGVCGSTLLNYLEKLSLPPFEVPKTLGVDEFAFRKGKQYGTILVDLDRHQPIALLADRKAETLADWLKQHPGVEVLSRDRSTTYRNGMMQGAPAALQVADRFHLVQNLGETLEQVLSSYTTQLKAIEQQQRQASTSNQIVMVTPRTTATVDAQARTRTTYQRRVQQQQQIKELYQQQWTQIAIAEEVGVSERTVRRLLKSPDLPPDPPHRRTLGKSLLDPYKQMLLQWWNEGVTEAVILMGLLQQQGYGGSERTLTRYLSRLREAQGLPPKRVQSVQGRPKVSDPQSPPLTARRASFLILQREEYRNPQAADIIARLVSEHPDLAEVVQLAEEFLNLLRQRQAEGFEPWLVKALDSTLKPIRAFAEGLSEDAAAVGASMMLDVSNGMVEGFNNRLKMVKRQMFGRAGLDLLSKRFILTQ